MKCPHCVTEINVEWDTGEIKPKGLEEVQPDDYNIVIEVAWLWKAAACPACNGVIVELEEIDVTDPVPPLRVHTAYPKFPRRKVVGDDVPKVLREDYVEACNVLSISPKASAALSRRILQAILNYQGYSAQALAQQVDEVLKESSPDKVLPSSIRSKIDVVRNLGNFAAHPIEDKSNSEVIEVESEEAGWCLGIIEALFDHYYAAPSQADLKLLGNLNKKLARAGKSKAKS